MKFLLGVICGLVVAITVPVAMVLTGGPAERRRMRPQKAKTHLAHEAVNTLQEE